MALSLQDLQRKWDDVTAFMESETYVAFRKTLMAEIDQLNESILRVPPVTPEDVALMNQSFGQREAKNDVLKIFEDIRGILKNEIADLQQSGQQIAETTNT